jgi:hypothetical protein
MNKQLAEFIMSLPFGFMTDSAHLERLISLDRMFLVLVRCGNGRFLTPAQNVEHFVKLINDSKVDHVRDCSIPCGTYNQAKVMLDK